MKYSVLLAILVAGCTTVKFREIPEYKISKIGTFVVSESPELWKFYDLDSDDTKQKDLQFYVSNSDGVNHTLNLDKAVIIANQERVNAKCITVLNDVSTPLVIASGKVFKIFCPMGMTPNSQNQLAMKDTLIRLEIPTDGKLPIVIERVYRIEDFQ